MANSGAMLLVKNLVNRQTSFMVDALFGDRVCACVPACVRACMFVCVRAYTVPVIILQELL